MMRLLLIMLLAIVMATNEMFRVVRVWLRDWSLITGRGGLQNRRGGHVKFYPYEKGGRKKFEPC